MVETAYASETKTFVVKIRGDDVFAADLVELRGFKTSPLIEALKRIGYEILTHRFDNERCFIAFRVTVHRSCKSIFECEMGEDAKKLHTAWASNERVPMELWEVHFVVPEWFPDPSRVRKKLEVKTMAKPKCECGRSFHTEKGLKRHKHACKKKRTPKKAAAPAAKAPVAQSNGQVDMAAPLRLERDACLSRAKTLQTAIDTLESL